MASDQSYYPSQQKPYNGSAPRSRPPQGYQQPQQQHPQQGYEQYPQDPGYDGYDNGYTQDYNGGGGYDMNGGRGNGYPPQQDYYGGPRGGGMPQQNRSRGGPAQRPPPGRGGYDQRGIGAPTRGYGPPGSGRGGRPGLQDYGRTSDPGSRSMRQPMGSPTSPGPGGWDNQYPDQRLAQKMGNMDLGASGQSRTRPAGGQGQQPGRNYPAQGYPDQRRGAPGYDNRGYGPVSPLRDDFAPPPRSMTMPGDQRQPGPRQVDERPYNGPIGRGIPPRPSTATGGRPPPQRTYPPTAPQQNTPGESYGYQAPTHDPHQSISDFYDSYYETGNSGTSGHARSQSAGEEMPNFDVLEQKAQDLQRQQSIEEHIKPSGGFQGQVKPVQSQPDMRARAQPQAAVFEMAGEAPPMPGQYQQGYDQGYPNDRYASQNGPNGQQPGYGGFNSPPAPNAFQPPPRNASIKTGLPSGPKPGMANGTAPQAGPPNGPPQTLSPDALPSHPTPIRAGLIPNSGPNQINSRPPPVRNYNSNSPGTPQQPSQSPGPGADAPPVVTEAELDQLRVAVRNNPTDQAMQLLLAKKLVEASDVLVPKIPDQRARNKAREKYIMDAHRLLKKLVASVNADAMFYLADCYGRGSLGLEMDTKEAFSLYQSAAKAGHAAAAYRTAVCCEIGNEEGGGTRKDPMKAIQWYKRAAMLGDPPAMYKMGMIQLKGLLGQPKNPREAVGWLKRAAERADEENPHALHELGLLYEQPQGPEGSIVRDEAYSLTLFQKAADLGYKFSQFRMGCGFEYGLFNLPVDPRQSIMWYSRAAVQEEHQSELALSGWYLTGSEGVLQQSDTEAYLWARKAALAGLAKAEYAMGYFTEVGIGIPANLEDAKRWYWRAAAQNFPKARDRLEDLKKNGSKMATRPRERISRSKVGKQNEGDCTIM